MVRNWASSPAEGQRWRCRFAPSTTTTLNATRDPSALQDARTLQGFHTTFLNWMTPRSLAIGGRHRKEAGGLSGMIWEHCDFCLILPGIATSFLASQKVRRKAFSSTGGGLEKYFIHLEGAYWGLTCFFGQKTLTNSPSVRGSPIWVVIGALPK